MKILFIHTPKRIEESGRLIQSHVMIPPIGLWSLADMCAKSGHDVEILHSGIEALNDAEFAVEKYVQESGADLVCFSLHWHLQLHEAYLATRAVKEKCPGAKVMVGGISATAFRREIMDEWPQVDFIAAGEAERTLEALLRTQFESPEKVPGLSWRAPDGAPSHNESDWCAAPADLDLHSHVCLERMRHNEYYRGRYFFDARTESFERWRESPRAWYLYVGRGCTVNCAYCGGGRDAHGTLSGRAGISTRTTEAVAADMKIMVENHGAKSFYICFDPPGMDPGYYPKLFSQVRGELKTSMAFEYYKSAPDSEFIRSFADAFTPETSQLILSPTAFSDATRRRCCPSALTNDQTAKMLEETERAGVPAVLYYSPMPQEPPEELMMGLRFARSLLRRFTHLTIIIMPIEIEPLSPWALRPDDFGVRPIRTTFNDYMAHHRRRRGVFTEEDLGCRFENFESIMKSIANFCDDPRWVCFYPYIYDANLEG